MALALYAHPFSSYCWKVLIALDENATPFEYIHLETPGAAAALHDLWPLRKFPVLVDDGRTIAESSIIIEHLALFHPGPVPMLPADPMAALPVRFLDRFFDNHVMTPMQAPVAEKCRTEAGRFDLAMAETAAALDTAYAWLETRLAGNSWAAGDAFTLADCAAAPALFYADWVHPIADRFPTVRAYRRRLLARPSVARVVDAARPYRHYFPLGAPDRD